MPKSITIILRLIIRVAKSNYYAARVRLPAACISVAPIGWISVKFDFGDFYDNLFRNSKISLKSDKKYGNFLLLPEIWIGYKTTVVQHSILLYC